MKCLCGVRGDNVTWAGDIGAEGTAGLRFSVCCLKTSLEHLFLISVFSQSLYFPLYVLFSYSIYFYCVIFPLFPLFIGPV